MKTNLRKFTDYSKRSRQEDRAPVGIVRGTRQVALHTWFAEGTLGCLLSHPVSLATCGRFECLSASDTDETSVYTLSM